MLSMVRLSGSAVFQILISTTSYIGVMRVIASFGSASVAAATGDSKRTTTTCCSGWQRVNCAHGDGAVIWSAP